MKISLNINNEFHEIEAAPGESLLDALRGEGFFGGLDKLCRTVAIL